MQRSFVSILSLILCVNCLFGQQEIARKGFSSPFDFPLLLSGNFGELRENHFHGGLDFKTNYQTGKRILALADGYINRVQVSNDSGYTIHVRYNNGFTTINRHCEGLVGALAEYVDSIQYSKESWLMSADFRPNQFPVRRGQQIAWSGNMGYSFAPHLHLDVYETKTGDYIDPLPFFQKQIKDTKAPRALGFMVYPQRNTGVVDGTYKPQKYAVDNVNPILAWGKIGVAIRAYDYMDNAANKYGVKKMKVFVDDEQIFESYVDRYAYSEHRYINSWSYNDYMKAFIEPNNKLRMLKAMNGDKGIVDINEERNYEFKFVLSDQYNNTSTYYLTVIGEKQEIPTTPSTQELKWDQYNHYSSLGLDLSIPKNQLYADADLCVDTFPQSSHESAESLIYQLIDKDDYVPFHRMAKLAIRVPDNYPNSKNKLYIARINDKNKLTSVGGIYKDGFISTTISKLGTFTLALDTIPPQVTALNKQNWSKQKKVTFKAKDYETGIQSYYGTIDGVYALFYLDIMPDNICYNIDPKRIKRGKEHEIILRVTDRKGNKTIVKETFYW